MVNLSVKHTLESFALPEMYLNNRCNWSIQYVEKLSQIQIIIAASFYGLLT